MVKIEFNNDTFPGISKEILKALQDNIENAIETDTVLYENSLGNDSEISLSKNLEDYDYICIIFLTTDNEKTIRIDNANGKSFYQSFEYSLGNDHIHVFSKFSTTQNKIIPITTNCGYYSINYLNNSVTMHLDRTNYIKISKVIGYKKGV